MQYIKWFREISKNSIPLAGGKGANLGEMTKMGLPVPLGFVVSSKAYDHFLDYANLRSKIKETLKDLDPGNTIKVTRAGKEIKDAILAVRLSEDLKKEIRAAYKKLGKDVLVAVRSSATAEDLPTASFAGQQATFLNIKGEDNVTRAVLKSYASLFEPRAIFYRITNKFDHLKVKIAVPIQEMVQSDSSGIMFTLDPLTSDKTKVVIEAGYGLGEAIVSGSITPDRYLVDKKSLRIVGKEIHKQTWQIKKVGNVDKHVSVSKKLQGLQKIADHEIINLARYGLKIEKHYKFPQDIEWAIEKKKVYFVQTRPITTIKQVSSVKHQTSEKEAPKGEALLQGLGASMGVVSGPVRLVDRPTDEFKDGEVLVAEMTNPSFVPLMKKAVAIVTDTGGSTSHAAIVSRELGVPCVVGTGKATHVLKNGLVVTVDGAKGAVYKGSIDIKVSKAKEVEEQKENKNRQEIVPITGTKVYVNLAEPQIAETVAKEPCDGVGLLRAEFMIAEIGEHPKYMLKKGKGKEFALKLSEGIKTIAESFNPRPVVYRATDFKTNEYKGLKGGEEFEGKEQNPMLGFRGAMRYILEPEVFKLELWAIKRVREQFGLHNVWLMIPFVRTVEELEKVKQILEDEGIYRTHDFKLWMMAEVPSNVFLIDQFCQAGIDGISIGSNDLTQLTLGIDRDNEKIASGFDERNEAITLAIKHIITACRKYHVTCSLCGQAASVYPEFLQMLIESGITSVSINPDVIFDTKKLIASIEKRILLEKIKKIEGFEDIGE
ncbi:MAG: phosphoenolpyruvate synthase [Candidatus Berkelbacteria bacterium]|nr:phosphoenolpyruvate synthase [Candidatus Berkelbacteria bacterium]